MERRLICASREGEEGAIVGSIVVRGGAATMPEEDEEVVVWPLPPEEAPEPIHAIRERRRRPGRPATARRGQASSRHGQKD
jgi:hypothetical protein